MPIDPFNKDPFGSLSGIHDLHRLGEGPKDLAAQSLASIASPLSALDSLQASRQFDPATASALNDFQRFGQPPKDITAQSLASIVPPLSTLDSLQASRQFDPATAGAMKTLLAKPVQSVLDAIASTRHGLQSVSPLLSERIQHLIPEDIGFLAKHRDMLDAVLPKWSNNLADLSTANSFISADLAAAQSVADLNMPGLHAAMAKSTVADPLAGSAYRDATNFAKSLFDGVLPTSGILKDLTHSALDAAIAKSASLDSAEGMLARSAIKDLERFQSLATQHKSVFDTAAQFAAASIASPFQGTLWGDRLQDAIVGVSLARTAGIDPHDFLFDSPELQAAEILDEANHLDPDDTAAALAWQTDAYRRIGEAFTKLLGEVHDAPPLKKVVMLVTIGMTILGFIGTIESALQGFERLGRWVSDTLNTEQHQAADDVTRSRNELLAGAYAAVSMVSALQQSCYVTKHDAPVRATPGRTGKLIGHLPAGTCVLVLERDGRWLRFAYQPPGTDASTEAWVYRDHLMAATE